MRALWIVAAAVGAGILIFAHTTVLEVFIGIACLGLAAFLYRRPLTLGLRLGHR